MNKELIKIPVNLKLEEFEIEEESIKLKFKEGEEIVISSYHDQDCCEHVYADFSVFTMYVDEINKEANSDYEPELKGITIKQVLGDGILVNFEFWNTYVKVFVPCYDYQNGYYSDQLAIKINNKGVETTIDVSDCVEHHID